jgi:hypothetical protein
VPADLPFEPADPRTLPAGRDKPSLGIARGQWNAMVNPAHAEAHRIAASAPEAAVRDARLFR